MGHWEWLIHSTLHAGVLTRIQAQVSTHLVGRRGKGSSRSGKSRHSKHTAGKCATSGSGPYRGTPGEKGQQQDRYV